MDINQAKQKLGLTDEALASQPETTIKTALAEKQRLLDEKISSAPTPALADKFRQSKVDLEQVTQWLLSEFANEANNQPETTQSTRSASSSLSQTMMADMPLSGTAFDTGSSMTTSQVTALPIGHKLANRYRITEVLGHGGMGVVYAAFDEVKEQAIAIKMVLPHLSQSERAKQRFMDEAKLSSNLSHPSIVNVFDVQQDGEHLFLTMELLEGQELRALLSNQQQLNQQMEIDDALDIINKLCDALEYAHRHTVHRDIKPENIFLCEDGSVKLMDFGIARVLSNTQRTQTGAATGTAYYMAPEQLKGMGTIDGRADQYALAVLLYEMLTGEVPTGRIESLCEVRADVLQGLSDAVDQGLSNKPDQRFADITTFNRALTSTAKPAKAQITQISKRSSHTSNKFVPVALSIALLTGTGFAYQQGLLDGIIADLTPVDKALIAEHQAQAGRLQGEIKTIARRFDNGVRDLTSELRDAERNNSNNLELLRLAQRLTKDYLVDGNLIPDLEGKLAQAQTLLRTQNLNEQRSAQTLLLLEEVKAGYQNLWQEFNASKSLYASQTKATSAKAQLEVYLAKQGYGQSEKVKQGLSAYQMAMQARSEGHFTQANKVFSESEPLLTQALVQAKQVEVLKTKAKSSKTQLEAYLTKQGYGQSEQGKQGVSLYQDAIEGAGEGNLVQASKSFSNSAALMKQALSQAKHVNSAFRIAQKSQVNLYEAIEKYSLQTPEQVEAKAFLKQGNSFARHGLYSEAIQRIDNAAQSYESLLNGLSGDIDKVKERRVQASKIAREKAAREKAAREKAAREKAARDKALKIKSLIGKMVVIPSGSFLMGASGTYFLDDRLKMRHSKDVQPVHKVSLPSFKMMEHEVTFALWDACVADGGCSHRPSDEGWGRDKRPVINVSFKDINEQFIPWISKITGSEYSLPSEAQWEYAARAGGRGLFSWGSSTGFARANCEDCGSRWDDRKTAPVKSFSSNRWGLFDMHGNVSELTNDCWNDNYLGAPTNGNVWSSGDCTMRVLRGGRFSAKSWHMMLMQRQKYYVLFSRSTTVGFRLVQDD
ncbi:bifunctional serine/threonine-protein kinase/formylglycine-generating enzyme family protein [Vibrio methylphosphonaticus]|uniref:bifunctional serine/threonine-protein kinase/formylglycine-generating enzyme family protein n=1 Tax=Vibrio methylphosphonaticus TaxID=2946866 RepID=UPI00202ABDB3|nr:bifunctional serine/threonine-protein kinase/formylglycine-generating enzyme family protein [Vibrio methylphosphonaticus]MCL9777276.1 SUMF1/EgtB/PvdO family nonheme iron enzyme [Vibrio methylphosphonaticus]